MIGVERTLTRPILPRIRAAPAAVPGGRDGRRLGAGLAITPTSRPQPAEPVATAEPSPSPSLPDRADGFETVTDRTPIVVPR